MESEKRQRELLDTIHRFLSSTALWAAIALCLVYVLLRFSFDKHLDPVDPSASGAASVLGQAAYKLFLGLVPNIAALLLSVWGGYQFLYRKRLTGAQQIRELVTGLIPDHLGPATKETAEATSRIEEQIREIRSGIGLTVEYFDGRGNQRHLLFETAIKLIKNAKKSIRVLNAPIPEIQDTDDPEVVGTRDEYYSELIKASKERGVLYERIIQIPKDVLGTNPLPRFMQDSSYRRHIVEMENLRRSAEQPHCYVRVADASRYMTFVLIDDDANHGAPILVLQINDPLKDGRMSLHGMFVYHDPAGVLIPHFRRFFNEADHSQGAPSQAEIAALEETLATHDTADSRDQ